MVTVKDAMRVATRLLLRLPSGLLFGYPYGH